MMVEADSQREGLPMAGDMARLEELAVGAGATSTPPTVQDPEDQGRSQEGQGSPEVGHPADRQVDHPADRLADRQTVGREVEGLPTCPARCPTQVLGTYFKANWLVSRNEIATAKSRIQ